MKQLFDFLPVAVFVAVYFAAGDFFVATLCLMGAVALQVLVTWVIERKVSKTLQFAFWIALVFGGLTVLLNDKTFLFWKPTIVNWCFAVVVIGSELLGRNVLASLLGAQMPLPPRAWRHLAWLWSAGFTIAGALNLFVAFRYSEAFWVGYKLWGGVTISLLQIGLTVAYLWRSGVLETAPTGQTPAAVDAGGADERNR